MSNNEDNRPSEKTPVEAGSKQRPDRMRPQRSQTPAGSQKVGPAIPPANSAANRRPPRQTQATPTHNQPMTRRAASRYQRDLQRQRQLVLATIVVIGLIVVVFLVGIFQSLIAPNIKTLAEVNGQTISSGDYYKFRKIKLFDEIGQLQQQLQFTQGDQQNQVQARIQLDQSELTDVTSHNVDQPTLETLASNIIAEKAAKDQFGISVSDDELSNYLKDQFLATIYTPTPNATGLPATATAGAANTAAAAIATSTANNTTPLPTATSSVTPTTTTASASPTTTTSLTPQPTGTGSANTTPGPASSGTTTPNLTPGATSSAAPAGTVSGTTTASTTVTATATVTPTATLTSTPIGADKVQATISTNQKSFLDAFKKATGLNEDDYRKFELRPQFVKKQVSQRLLAQQPQVGAPYPQIQASHILVKDEAVAKDLIAQLKAVPADQFKSKFIELARTKSEDTTSAAHNGDLGWFIEGMMVDPFYQAAQKLEKGQWTQDAPVKSDFGYHVIWVTDKSNDRPLDAVEYAQLTTTDQNGDYVAYTKWLKKQVEAAKPKYNTAPTPTTAPTQVPAPAFTPVIPPTVTATALPATAAPSPAAGTGTPGTAAAGTTTPGATTAASTTVAATTAAASTTAAATTAAATTATAPTPSPTK